VPVFRLRLSDRTLLEAYMRERDTERERYIYIYIDR